MTKSFQMLIDGQWLDIAHRRSLPVRNPATLETIGDLPLADKDDLDRAVDAARRGFALWRRSTPEQRAVVLRGAAARLRERINDIAHTATCEEGKTLAEARGEVMMGVGLLEFYAEECRRSYGRVLVRPTGARAMVLKEPVGPIAAFAPWNFPIGNPVRKLAAPIAAGCSVILKPPEEAPGSALHVARALVEAGLPPGVMQIVFGVPEEVSTHLLTSGVIRHASFTGSTAVGQHLMALAGRNGVRTTMELGGHGPVIIFDDAQIETAVEELVVSKFRNAGQVCIAPTRFYVQESVYEKFAAAFARRAARIVVGNGLEEGVQMGPLAHGRRPEAIQSLVDDAVSSGARLRLGGERLGREGYFYAPTVLTDIPLSARIMNEEPFGPVALIAPFKTFDEAVEQANRLPYGLASYAYTGSAKTAMLIADALESGMVAINGTGVAAPDAPFGGVKHSGHGSEDGPEGLSECLVTKVVHQH